MHFHGENLKDLSDDYSNLGELLPKITVTPPGPNSVKQTDILKEHESLSGTSDLKEGKVPVIWKYAKGCNVVDVDDNIYIDLSAGLGVVALGYSHPLIVETINSQTGKLMHTPSKSNPHVGRVELVEKLAKITPPGLNKSFLATSGALAVEIAMKAAKAYKKTYWFVAFHGGFHGNNMQGALSLTSFKAYRDPYHPLLPGIVFVPFPYCYRCAFGKEYPSCDLQCVRFLEYTITNPATGVGDVAAVVVEPVQGVAGWIVPPNEFLKGVRKICDENNILLILDEIYTGFGRTGKLFCFEHSNIIPDIFAVGKGMASGFPMAAAIGKGEVMDNFGPHTSTFMGNPIGCACSLASIDAILKMGLVERTRKLGEHFLNSLKEETENCSIVGDVRGKGLLVGIELVKDRRSKKPAPEEAEKVLTAALKRGLIFHSGGIFGNFIRMSPPLVITEEQVDYSVRAVCEALREVEKSR